MVMLRVVAKNNKHSGASYVINAIQFLFLWLGGLLLVPQLGGVHAEVLTKFWWYFVGGGVAFAITNVATYKSLTYVDAAVGSIFNTLNALCTIGLAALVLNEDLTAVQLVGASILTAAIIYSMLALRTTKKKLSIGELERGFGFALLAGVAYAIAIVNEKWLLSHMSAGSYVVFGWGWQMLASVVLAVVLQPQKLGIIRAFRTVRLIAAIGLMRAVAGVAFVLAQIRSDNVALVTVIANFKLIVVMILGAWLLRERHKLWQKTAGAFASLTGLVVMFWK